MPQYRYDALLVLGAVMKWNFTTEKWEFPAIIESYNGKLVLGKIRAFAASLLWNIAPTILVTGGSDLNPVTGKRDSRAIQLAKVITDKYCVPKDKVIPVGTLKGSYTLGNREDLINFLKTNLKILRKNRIAILSPRFQMARAMIMFRLNPYFDQNDIMLDWFMAEQVICHLYPKFERYERLLYSSSAAEINRQMEERGIRDLLSDTYKPVS